MRLTEFERDGLVFDVLDEGPLDGDVVVLLHGFPERNTCWRDVVPLLHEAGLRTLAPDQRGFSPRARPRRRRDYATAQFAADVERLAELVRDRTGAPVHLAGHDWGSAVAWTAAGRRPDLFASLTAVSVPHPWAFQQSWFRSTQLLHSWYMFAFVVPWVPELTARSPRGLFYRGLREGGMTREEVERCRREVVEYGALPGGLGWYRGMALGGATSAPRWVTVPTTLVWSDGDRFVGRRSVELSEACVRAPYELVVLDGVDHWIPAHAPGPLAEAMLRRIGSVRVA